MIKNIKLIVLFLIISFYSCENNTTNEYNENYVSSFPIPNSITSNNINKYPISLVPYEFKIILISNYGENINTNNYWWLDSIVYQVFVRSFMDNNNDGKGDLQGLISKLDYITNIGFNAIWTLPIFESPSTHGYDATDYYSIEKDYGDLNDFNIYVEECKKRNINIILDLVLNHTSSQHPWFISSKNKSGNYTSWYVWTNTNPTGWLKPWGESGQVWFYDNNRKEYYYGAFWSGMPDLNYNNNEVKNEIYNISRYWIEKGVDGYRLDAIRYLYENGPDDGQRDTQETLDFLSKYQSYLKSINSNFMTVGEIWANRYIISKYYYNGKGLDSAMDFDFAYSIINAFRSTGVRAITSLINNYYNIPIFFFSPFLDNHDEIYGNYRLFDLLNYNFKSAKLAAAILLTFPGTPYIYYGTEIGMKKGPQIGDTAKRTPMHWNSSKNAGFTSGTPWTSMSDYSPPYNVESQLTNKNSLLNCYKNLIKFRKTYEGLRRGNIYIISNNNPIILSYIRPGTNCTVLFIANSSSYAQYVELDFSYYNFKTNIIYPTVEVYTSFEK